MRRSGRLACAAAGVLIALATCVVVVGKWIRNPIRIAEQALHTTLPGAMERVAHEEKWLWFGGSGFSISVYRLEPNSKEDLIARCAALGMRSGRLADEAERLTIPERYIDPNAMSCYLLRSDGMSTKLVAVTDDRLVIYVSH